MLIYELKKSAIASMSHYFLKKMKGKGEKHTST